MRLLSLLVSSLPVAAVYALLGMGFVLVYRTTRVVNFAQGYLCLLGAYLMGLFAVTTHQPFGLALLESCALSVVAGALIYLLFLRTVSSDDAIRTVLVTIGVAYLIEAVIGMTIGPQEFNISSPISPRSEWHLGSSITLGKLDLAIMITAAIVGAALVTLLRFTRAGSAMRAVAQNRGLARVYGINVTFWSMLSWSGAMFACTIAGIGYGLRTTLDFSIINLGFGAFPAILLGGFDSIAGCIVGSIIFAYVQTIASSYLGAVWVDGCSLGLVLVFILIRPWGLFGTREVARI